MYARHNFDILLYEIEMEVGVMDAAGDDSWHRIPLQACACVCV